MVPSVCSGIKMCANEFLWLDKIKFNYPLLGCKIYKEKKVIKKDGFQKIMRTKFLKFRVPLLSE